ncbi:MAG: hypothetical protein QMC96_12155 [Methanomicrobiales archaeon]|nr:hypothetical protein [Methanomicrobiales archaeon]
MTRPVLYISGPFQDADPVHGIERNILKASAAALEAWQKGWVALCPHKNCSGFQHVGDYEADFWIEGDLVLLARSVARWGTRS